MLSAFGDDSADPKSERLFCVAAVVGSHSDWEDLEIKWRQRLGCCVFHAIDCESDRKAFQHFPHEENQLLYKDLTTGYWRNRGSGGMPTF